MRIRILILLLSGVLTNVVAVEMTRFQHSSGLSFSHPSAWIVREDGEGLLLIPDQVEQVGDGMPKEYFFFGLSDAPGVVSAGDPEVLTYFENMIATDVPGGARAGPIETLQTGVGRAVIIPFAGKPRGVESEILVYAVVTEEQGLYLVHIRDKAARSDRHMGRTIFASLNLQLQLDPDLAGSWVRTGRSSSSAGSYDTSQFSTTHLVSYEFDGAGNVAMKSDFSSSSVSDDVSVLSDGASNLHGSYSSLGEELYIEWEDGTEVTWIYSVFPDYNDGHMILKLQEPNTEDARFYDLSN